LYYNDLKHLADVLLILQASYSTELQHLSQTGVPGEKAFLEDVLLLRSSADEILQEQVIGCVTSLQSILSFSAKWNTYLLADHCSAAGFD
jgi:hypothetical protein